MKFKLGSKVYDAASIEDLSLKFILMLERETADLGRPMRWADITAMVDSLGAIEDHEERGRHPDAPWVLAVTIWAARRNAGEDLTFGEAIDFPLSGLTFLHDPQDRKEPKSDPRKARPGKGSGRAAAARAAAAEAGSQPKA